MDKTEKLKALEAAMLKIEKEYGKGSIMKLGEQQAVDVDIIPTGSIGLDRALGVGGIPRGRIVEIFGPEASGKTTLALHIVSEVQKAGGIAGFIDAEHAMDPKYARGIGVDVDNLYISQPDNGEQALEICETMVRSGAMDIIVIDSVAALVPKKEIEGEMGDAVVGLQARLMSQALRKLTAIVSKTNCTIIFINQLREKVGVVYGCLHADTIIPFTDGRAFPIRKIVEEQIQGQVWAYDEKTKEFVPKEIIDWHYNGNVDDNSDYIHIETAGLDSIGGLCGITVTPDHLVMTDSGWKKAKDIKITDKILTKYKSIVNGTLADFLYGALVGDSHISLRARNTAALRFQDSNNLEYVDWKVNKLKPFFNFHKVMPNQFCERVDTEYSTELAIIKQAIGGRDPLQFFNHYSDMGLAVWYMDDGHFDNAEGHCRVGLSVKRFSGNAEKLAAIQAKFAENGLIATCEISSGTFNFDAANTQRLFDKIAKYVPLPMQYKLDEKHQGLYEDFSLKSNFEYSDFYVSIKQIRLASDRQMRQRGKYDLSIEDCHNYLAGGVENGVLVHNSPEITTGGRALKFYASVRLDIRRIEALKSGGEVVGNRVRVKVVKNKVAPPFRETEFEIVFGKGISKTAEIIDMAAEMNIINKSGAWYSYEGEKIGQGKENVKKFFEANPDVFEEVEEKVREALFAPKYNDQPREETKAQKKTEPETEELDID